jgi:hypothetical protein
MDFYFLEFLFLLLQGPIANLPKGINFTEGPAPVSFSKIKQKQAFFERN